MGKGMLALCASLGLVAGCYDETVVTLTGGATGDGGGGTGTVTTSSVTGKKCGTQVCPEGEHCAWKGGSCETAFDEQVCEPHPVPCDLSGPPVCGCDGVTYASICEAIEAGVLLKTTFPDCEAAVDTFACGDKSCIRKQEHCLKVDVGGSVESKCVGNGSCTECTCVLTTGGDASGAGGAGGSGGFGAGGDYYGGCECKQSNGAIVVTCAP
ncbi:MAG: hypothetical protein R3B70_17075 [Polyangiaceae bacterium]